MKKLAAILLLLIHLFNFAGYILLFNYYILQSDARLVKRIEAGNYNRNSLIILKVPVRLPYYNDWNEFERVDGEIVIEGVHYTYVERKVSQDTLYLACLPNTDKTELSNSQNEYAKNVNGLPVNNKKSSDSNIKKNVLGLEYNNPGTLYNLDASPLLPNQSTSYLLPRVKAVLHSTPYMPPDLA